MNPLVPPLPSLTPLLSQSPSLPTNNKKRPNRSIHENGGDASDKVHLKLPFHSKSSMNLNTKIIFLPNLSYIALSVFFRKIVGTICAAAAISQRKDTFALFSLSTRKEMGILQSRI